MFVLFAHNGRFPGDFLFGVFPRELGSGPAHGPSEASLPTLPFHGPGKPSVIAHAIAHDAGRAVGRNFTWHTPQWEWVCYIYLYST